MKKNILRKDFYMEIRKSMGRFISIFFIVALGVAFYSGIRASEPSMRISGDSYFDKQELMDVKVMGTMGLTKDDIKAIQGVEKIETAEGGYSKDVLCPAGDTEKVVHMLSMQDSFNDVQVKEGRLPEKAGECLLDEDFLKIANYQVGDTITFSSGDAEALTDSLTTDTFQIVGIGNSPLYISFGRGNSTIGNGEVSGFVIVDEASFALDVYTEAYVRVAGLMGQVAFTDEYQALSDEVVSALKAIKDERCEVRRQSIIDEANEELQEAKDTVDEESTKLSDAQSELDASAKSAADQLAEAKQALDDAKAQLESSKQQIADGEALLAEGKKELSSRQAEIDQGWETYQSQLEALNQSEKELEALEAVYLENMKNIPLIQTGLEQITSNLEQLQMLQQGLTEVKAGIAVMEQQLTDGQSLFDTYSEVPEEEQTEEQKEYLIAWPQQKEALEQQKQGAKEQQAALEEQMQAAGFADEAVLAAQILELQAKKAELEAQLQALVAAGQQITDGKAQIADGRSQLAAAKSQLDSGQAAIDSAWKQIESTEAQLAKGRSKLASGEQEFYDGQADYEQAVTDAADQIADGQAQIADGQTQLTDAKQKIVDAEAEIAKIEHPKWYIQDRSDAVTEYDGYGENADRMRSLGKVFPVLFFLVAALISLTTMTRMVEEQRVQIGTLKALGYSKGAIAKKYVYYALAATLGGSVLGVLIGEKILPFIIIYAYKIMYQHIPDILVPYHLSYAVQATLISVACTLLATIFSCYKELASNPAVLMRPPSPKQGKRILLERASWLWKRLSFIWKSSIRNLFRYKKRFFMTVFGIGGCMALMLVGFGLKDCIYEIVSLQYEKIQFYDASVYFNDDVETAKKSEILDKLERMKSVSGYIQVNMQKMEVKSEGGKESLYLTVPKDEKEIENFVSFHSRTKDETYSLEKDQAILTEKVADLLDVKVGDTITIQDEEKGDKEVTIGAIAENYLGNYLYLSPELYESIYGAEPKYNGAFYAMDTGMDAEAETVGSKLLKNEEVLNVSYTNSNEARLDDMLRSLNLVIVVLIISAGMLAFVVLYNLNNINITERKRELATIKVLGFYDTEVASYVYRENVLLTLIGAGVGMLLGKLLLQYVIVTVEVNEAMFGREIHGPSYLYSLLFTIGFSCFVNWVMYFKLKKIDMVESLKSVE